MGELSRLRKTRNFHRIFEQIFEVPGIPIYEIAQKADLSRNTVSKYLQEMYEDHVLVGPQLRLLPAANYKEYVYLMNFKNPFHLFEGLREFPHVLYHGMTFGDWNAIVITDRLLDFSQLVGFETIVYQGVRYRSYTPRVDYLLWEKTFNRCADCIRTFTRRMEHKDRTLAPSLDWGEDQWKMYQAFRFNTRKTATTTLKRIGVRYETYVAWMEDLATHCTVHTGFYPEGYETYVTYCFLFSTEYEQSVRTLFSFFPTTPVIIEVGNQLMVFITVTLSGINRKLFCSIYDMKTQDIIRGFKQAVAVFHYPHATLSKGLPSEEGGTQ
ncbi:MAG: winged helix-turn-helix domain-containing protein [Candidatus Methanofastidiosia archaeon]